MGLGVIFPLWLILNLGPGDVSSRESGCNYWLILPGLLLYGGALGTWTGAAICQTTGLPSDSCHMRTRHNRPIPSSVWLDGCWSVIKSSRPCWVRPARLQAALARLCCCTAKQALARPASYRRSAQNSLTGRGCWLAPAMRSVRQERSVRFGI